MVDKVARNERRIKLASRLRISRRGVNNGTKNFQTRPVYEQTLSCDNPPPTTKSPSRGKQIRFVSAVASIPEKGQEGELPNSPT